jgi:hydroxymethylpyrimidine/phosphomethylpyrimidine kinase
VTGKPVRLLIIAGSDNSGGAGIQADIKTATALGAYAMTAVTAVTVQDTQAVRSVHPVPAAIVREQILACLDDIGADAIKTGMLGAAEMIETVADTLAEHARGIPLVVDPVMASTSGAEFLDQRAVDVLKARLIPLATIVTPNDFEVRRLSVMVPGVAFLVKGGHREDARGVVDVLMESNSTYSEFIAPRIQTANTHGTGCTLATAIACGLGAGFSLKDAVARAHGFVQEAIRTAPGFGKGRGPLNHMHKLRHSSERS